MAEVFIGSLMLVPYTFAPRGWAFCQGQMMSIAQNTALFSLLGTMYGGDGRSTFALPDLRGSIPVGTGQGPGLSLYAQGEVGGSSVVTLVTSEMPAHSHSIAVAGQPANASNPTSNGLSEASLYTSDSSHVTALNQAALSAQGGSQPHNNMMPFQALNWIIALQGIFPPRN